MLQLKEYVISVCWSQTEKECVIVEAHNKAHAMAWARERWCKLNMAHHVDYVNEITSSLKRYRAE